MKITSNILATITVFAALLSIGYAFTQLSIIPVLPETDLPFTAIWWILNFQIDYETLAVGVLVVAFAVLLGRGIGKGMSKK